MKKKYYFIIGFILFIALFFASPYILDVWQWKSALNAASGMPIYEGVIGHSTLKCWPSCPSESGPKCCQGQTPLCFEFSLPPACVDFDMIVAVSAGGVPCPSGYLFDPATVTMVQGSSNIILAGTTCNALAIIASEKGCIGCTAMINNDKVYLVKNKIKRITNFIIAGFRD